MNSRLKNLTVTILLFLTTVLAAIAFNFSLGSKVSYGQEDFLDPEVAFVFSAAMAKPQRLDVHFKIAPKYYMYKDRFQFFIDPQEHETLLGQVQLPQGVVQYDPTFDEDLEVYYGQITLQIPIEQGAQQPINLSIISQGCADAGLCYSPSENVVTLSPTPEGYVASGQGIVSQVPSIEESTSTNSATEGAKAAKSSSLSQFDSNSLSSSNDVGFAAYLNQASFWQVVAWSALFGLLLSFTPCVLPMVPILLAILAGGDTGKNKVSRGRGFGLSAVFVLGMSLVYTALGIAAGLVGASLSAWLQTPWVLAVFAGLLILFALAMFDVFTFQTPTGMQSRLNSILNRIPGGRFSGVFLMGMLSALIVGPCVAAPLAGILLFISQTGDVFLGGTSLFAMAWGQGVLLLAVGASSGVLLPRAGAWMQGVKTLFGVLLLATAWWMLHPALPIWVIMLGWAFLALLSAVLLGTFSSNNQPASVARAATKAIGMGLVLWAAVLVVGVAGGGQDLLRPLKPFAGVVAGIGVQSSTLESKPVFSNINNNEELNAILSNTSKPVMLDFYADWCVSCIQMERFTFTDPNVAQLMAQMQLVKADVTANTPEHRDLLKRFNLFGPPGIIFFNSNGEEIQSVRVVGFQNAGQFARELARVLK